MTIELDGTKDISSFVVYPFMLPDAEEVANWPGLAEQCQKIQREQQAYEAQHAALLTRYKGQYIAMHEGKLIDHDLDRVALSRRIRNRYGSMTILLTQVREEPRLTIHLRSPRLITTGLTQDVISTRAVSRRNLAVFVVLRKS